MADRFKLIPEAHVFLMNGNDEVLLLRRYNTGYGDGKYSVIAGHIDGNEEVRSAAIREAREEAGIEIRLSDIEVVGVIHRKDEDERVAFFLAASRWSGNIVNAEPHRCDDLSWHSIRDLPPNMVPYVRRAIENYLNGRFYDSFGWD
ncbi:MAG: NUDIX domain-containing protein [Candidatus Latescibacteria bacterium]|nr:NUDIX domain-containing protein [Candidatus Latescibacterota bacterium]